MKPFVYDFETGGLNSKIHPPLQFGACVLDFDSGKIIETFETLIKFDDESIYDRVEQEAMLVHKISIDDCKKCGMTTDEIADRVMDIWTNNGCSVQGGHNNPFDQRFMARWIFKVEPEELEKILSYRHLDSYPVIQLMMGTELCPPGTSLKQVAKKLNVDMSDVKGSFHGALYDSIVCAKVLYEFRRLVGTKI